MNLESHLAIESRVNSPFAAALLDQLGDYAIEQQLDDIRRQSLLSGQFDRSEEARAWLEFSRATTRFYDRLAKGRNPR